MEKEREKVNLKEKISLTESEQKTNSIANIFDSAKELAPLPSKGLVYPVGSPLYKKSDFEVKEISASEEDILVNRVLLKKGQMISTLIRSCSTIKSVDPMDMLIADRNSILTTLRIISYGPEYDVEVQCEDCEYKFEERFYLNEVAKIKCLDYQPVEEGNNEFPYSFNYKGKKIDLTFKMFTGKDEKEISRINDVAKKKNLLERNITLQLFQATLSVNGVTDRSQIKRFIEKMGSRYARDYRDFISEKTPDLEMNGKIECPNCGHEQEVDLPITANFFWPDARR